MEKLKGDEITGEYRICTECGKKMKQGYITGDFEYFCSDECLHKHISAEEWEELYNENPDENYWTEWE